MRLDKWVWSIFLATRPSSTKMDHWNRFLGAFYNGIVYTQYMLATIIQIRKFEIFRGLIKGCGHFSWPHDPLGPKITPGIDSSGHFNTE